MGMSTQGRVMAVNPMPLLRVQYTNARVPRSTKGEGRQDGLGGVPARLVYVFDWCCRIGGDILEADLEFSSGVMGR